MQQMYFLTQIILSHTPLSYLRTDICLFPVQFIKINTMGVFLLFLIMRRR